MLMKRMMEPKSSEVLPDDFEIFSKGTVSIRVFRANSRRVIRYGGRDYLYSRILWNVSYPDDKVGKGDVVHHKNENTLDDKIENYEKLTKSEHTSLHMKGNLLALGRKWSEEAKERFRGAKRSEEFKERARGRKHSQESKDKMSATRKERGFRPPVPVPSWPVEEAMMLLDIGWTYASVGRKYGVCYQTIRQVLLRRGYRKSGQLLAS
jgi:hypothetical protein